MKKILFTIISLFVVCNVFAQDIEVKKFEPKEKDQTEVLNPRKDINGVECGLMKVQLKEVSVGLKAMSSWVVSIYISSYHK